VIAATGDGSHALARTTLDIEFLEHLLCFLGSFSAGLGGRHTVRLSKRLLKPRIRAAQTPSVRAARRSICSIRRRRIRICRCTV
jgi:hypothetical protein